ncbi:hypothetical protein LJR045_002165 [Microbacterium sp. LjRoot45]|uniref:hypothetical protein n=1 Tax=Microbacterium sp. LjRoot45 TaxID=3342329 RepID=UPI003ED0E474
MLFRELTAGVPARVGISDGIAFAELHGSADGRTAKVGTPGSGWYALAVDGGFSLDHFGEDDTTEEITEILRELVVVGTAYLERGGVVEKPRSFSPALMVKVGADSFVLRRSLLDELRRAWRRSWPLKRQTRG